MVHDVKMHMREAICMFLAHTVSEQQKFSQSGVTCGGRRPVLRIQIANLFLSVCWEEKREKN